LGFSLAGSALALALDGCCGAGFLLSWLPFGTTFLGAGALKKKGKFKIMIVNK